jgi:NADPH:quinone reductase
MRAVQIEEFGGPEVLQVAEVDKPEPGEGQVLIEVSRAGMNFADTHQRENSYLARYETPLILGGEVAGTTPDGRRVVALVPSGGYAEFAVAHSAAVYDIPDGLDEGAALALLIQGLTAWHLFRTSARLGAGESAVDPGADDLTAALVEANEGNKVDVVLEMSGGRVFDACAEALAPFGRIVAYGIASREQNTVETGRLMRKSRTVAGFWLMHCLGRREMMEEPLADLFERAVRGDLVPQMGETYPMSEVRRAHEDLQGRRTSGKLLLDPAR